MNYSGILDLLLPLLLTAQLQAPNVLVIPDQNQFSIEQAMKTALEKNLLLKAEIAKEGIADGEITTASAIPNPVLVSDNGIAEDSYRLGIQQTIMLGGKIKNRVRLAQSKKEMLSAELRAAILQLRADVRKIYVQLYSLQERHRILLQLLQDYEDFKHVSADFEDKVQIEFIATSTRNELSTVKYEEELARNNLNSLLARPLSSALLVEKPRSSIAGNLPLSALVSASLNKAPDLMQNLAQSNAAKNELALARSNRVPNFSFVVGPDLVTPPEVPQWNVFAIGFLDLPVFNRQQGPIKESLARQNQLGLLRNALRQRAELEVTNAYASYQHSLKNLNEYEVRLIPAAQELQSQAKQAHRSKTLTVDTLVEADTHRAGVEINYLKYLVLNQEAISKLEQASGLEL